MARETTTTRPKSSKRWTSRAVSRLVEPGTTVECQQCGQRVKFQARARNEQVICNVYEDGRWDRVEHFHAGCYGEAGQPYGAPQD